MDMEVDVDYQTSSPSKSLITKKLNQEQDVMTTDIGMSTGVMVSLGSTDFVKSSTSGSNNSADQNCSTSDLSFQDDGNDDEDEPFDDGEDYGMDDEVASDYGDDDDYVDDDDDDNDDDYLKLQAQFDNVDLPPGVEATVSWPEPSPSEEKPSANGPSTSRQEDKSLGPNNMKARSGLKIIKEETMDEVLRKLMYFKQFDTVTDFSDHHYSDIKSGHQPAKSWAKKIQDEWKILEQNLPETIFVRVYESRMDLLRAVIVGPAGTPYHDGLFLFDVVFPPSYPCEPPLVFFHSSGFRMNPNLYECGKVCLSLLNTWQGGRNEMWQPDKSTMLQVLVSIQALILNAVPFFNEPGYDKSYQGEEGKKKAREYSENVFVMSLKKMIYTIRNPPQHFEDLAKGHFRVRAVDILTACQAYAGGAEVACNIKKWQEDGVRASKPGSLSFKADVSRMMKTLLKYFIDNGSKDCEKFQD